MTANKIPQLPSKRIGKLWKKVQMMPSGCWEWHGSNDRGYGRIFYQGITYTVTRVVYYLYYAIDPEEFAVCHKCDNPPCVNPLHLFLGTNSENILDMHRKGRHRPTGPRNPVKGESHTGAKLKDAQVRDIRSKYATGQYSLNQLAREYGVSKRLILVIKQGKAWKHLL